MATRGQVVRITASWADATQQGTGFVVRVGMRTLLVTALHVVHRVGAGGHDDWAHEVETDRFGMVDARAEHSLDEDWVVFDLGAVQMEVLATARATPGDLGREVATFGFPAQYDEGLGLRGSVTSTHTEAGGVASLQVHFRELAARLDLRGVSGGPLMLGDEVVGVVKSFLLDRGQGHARGRVRVWTKAATQLAAGAVLLRDDQARYAVATTCMLDPAKPVEVEVIAELPGRAYDLAAGARMTIASPPFGAVKRVLVVEGIVGGADRLPSSGMPGQPIGGVAFACPIERILERLGAMAPPAWTPEDHAAARTLALPRPGRRGNPELLSHWLAAAEQKVDFDTHARRHELALLEALCGDDGHGVVALLGMGGVGKTRLMLHWCAEMRARGWLAGFLAPGSDAWKPLLYGRRPRVIVIDYVERDPWPARRLLEAMQRDAELPPIKLVLLARGRGHWFEELRKWLDEGDLVPIESAYPDAESREAAFRVAIAAYDGDPNMHCPDLMARREYERPLYIQMRAMLALLGEDDVDDPLARVLARERESWRAAANPQTCGVTCRDALERGMLATALCGGWNTLTEVRGAFDRVGVEASERNRVIDVLHQLYPREGTPEGIVALEPDLLAEQLVVENFRQREGEVDMWLNLPFELGNGAAALDLLSRVARARATEQARGWLVRMLMATVGEQRRCEVLIRAITHSRTPASVQPSSASLLEAVRAARDVEVATRMSGAIGVQSLQLLEVSEAANRLLVEVARGLGSGDDARASLAMSLNNLGNMLSGLGRREEAEAATREAVEIRRGLAKARPDAFLPDLATSLNNLGNMLSGLGRREEAEAATREAVDVYRGLAKARPDAFLPNLAASLNNLGAMLSGLGRREEAEAATREAVEAYRGLAKARPDAFLPDLAASLNNLGMVLSGLGRREEAEAATREAVEIRRGLAKARPDAFLPDLAGSLNNLGMMLSGLGRREEAEAATREAVEVYRRLAKARPDAFLPNLAGSLNNLGSDLSELGRREEAEAATREAVEIRRGLAKARPDTFLPDLATSLNNLGSDLSGLGRREEAEAATREAVEAYRGLAKARPDAFLPDLATSLNNLGNMLSELGRREEAEAATREGLEIRRGLAKARPDAFLPDLAMSLGARGQVLLTANAPSAAADAFAEGLRILLPLLARYRAAFMPLALTLASLLDQACQASARPLPDDLAEPVTTLLARATKT